MPYVQPAWVRNSSVNLKSLWLWMKGERLTKPDLWDTSSCMEYSYIPVILKFKCSVKTGCESSGWEQERLPELIQSLNPHLVQGYFALWHQSRVKRAESTSRAIGNSAALHYNSKPQALHHLRENHSAFWALSHSDFNTFWLAVMSNRQSYLFSSNVLMDFLQQIRAMESILLATFKIKEKFTLSLFEIPFQRFRPKKAELLRSLIAFQLPFLLLMFFPAKSLCWDPNKQTALLSVFPPVLSW